MVTNTNKNYISREELQAAGYSNYKINQMIAAGGLIAINRRYFENPHYSGSLNDFYSVLAYAEQGVICLVSAAVYHGLSSERPQAIDVAIPRRSRMPADIGWPSMHFYRFSDERYNIGKTTVIEEGNTFHIYDMEKTVCDMVFYRNELGFEPTAEVLKRYARMKDRDLNKLMDYAQRLRVGKSLAQYMEILV